MSMLETPDVNLMVFLFSFSGGHGTEVNDTFIRQCPILSGPGYIICDMGPLYHPLKLAIINQVSTT